MKTWREILTVKARWIEFLYKLATGTKRARALLTLLPLFPGDGGLRHDLRQLSWIQLALAVSVLMIELGSLLMYQYGSNLGAGNLVTGVFINLIFIGLGMTLLGEKVNLVNAIGIAFCILGVALVNYRSWQAVPGVLMIIGAGIFVPKTE